MLYALKKDELYVANAISKLNMRGQYIAGNKVKFELSANIRAARLLESINYKNVERYGLHAVCVQLVDNILVEVGNIYEH